jgi:hypothetical protein
LPEFNMLDTVTILVEIAFVVSLLGFFLLLALIPSKKAIRSGTARGKMDSPIVPVLIVVGVLLAFAMIPLAIVAVVSKDMTAILGFVNATVLFAVYGGIFYEYRGSKKALGGHIAVEEVSVETVQPMTVECPRCRGHLSIPHGSHAIICPHCGLSGSL